MPVNSTSASIASIGLEKLLLRLNLASDEQIAATRAATNGGRLISALARRGVFNEGEALAAIGKNLGIPVVPLFRAKLVEKLTQDRILEQVKGDFLARHCCVPIEVKDSIVVVAFADPLDLATISDLEFMLGSKVQTVLARESDIQSVLTALLTADEARQVDQSDSTTGHSSSHTSAVDPSIENVSGTEETGAQAAPIVKLVHRILSEARAEGASDVHFEPTANALDVRFRVDGVLSTYLSIPKRVQAYVSTRVKVLAQMDIAEKRRPQDGRIHAKLPMGEVDIRVSSVPTPAGEKLVLRLLGGAAGAATIEQLSMPEHLRSAFEQGLKAHDKLILVCGPTGSGKTTTLYAALQHVRVGTNNIITVEDPIENRIDGITQIQVDSKIGMTFASALRSVLRQDPDIVLIGEIRDTETGAIALQAAQTGHLVLSTLHANSAPAAVVRLVDLGMEPFVVASSLGMVVAQRLVRRLCVKCAVPLTSAEGMRRARELRYPLQMLREAGSCDACAGHGYKGRIGVYSLLTIDDTIREAIRSNKSEAEIAALGRSSGYRPVEEELRRLVLTGITSIAEAESAVGVLAPLATDQLPERSISTESAPERIAPKPRVSGTAKILVVDDDEGVRAVLCRILKKSGFTVCEASSGYQGIDLAKNELPDLIISDLVMPGVSGRELVVELRQYEPTKSIPILMLTGSDSESNEILLIEAGADDFMSKASSPQLVIARVRRLLRAHESLST